MLVTVQPPERPYRSPAPSSDRAFADGRRWRIEIPSVESPAAVAAVLDEATTLGVPVSRISQGSGIQLLLDAEIRDMVTQCQSREIELCLFVGPRASFDIGASVLSSGGAALTGAVRGSRQLGQAVDDAVRAAALGVDGVLVADVGLLATLATMREDGRLPSGFVLKVSVLAAPANPAAVAVLAAVGADSINVPSDLSAIELAEMRASSDVPLDFYVEAPDDMGGFVRHHDIAELVRVAAPIYLKFGLRNSPPIYPAGRQLEATVLASARERVRRAAIGLEHFSRLRAQVSPTRRASATV